MKHSWKTLAWGLAAAAALALSPFRSSDVAELIPVEVLVISRQDGLVQVDGGELRGSGTTWRRAWEDLRRGAPGTVFLGTAEYVVLEEQAAGLLPELLTDEVLRPAARVCFCRGPLPTAREAAPYLTVQEGGVTLQAVHAALLRGEKIALPILRLTEGGLRLYEAPNG